MTRKDFLVARGLWQATEKTLNALSFSKMPALVKATPKLGGTMLSVVCQEGTV